MSYQEDGNSASLQIIVRDANRRRPDRVGLQVDDPGTRTVDPSVFQEVQEVLLARLPEGEPVEGEVIFEGHDFGGIPAE